MGLDLYIEARIKEKETGRIISSNQYNDKFADDENKGFFEICWWCSSSYRDVRTKMIEISNKHAGTNYIDSDFIITIPQSALREIYAYLVSRSYLSDDEYFEVLPCDIEWEERASYEKMNLVNAGKLHDLLSTLSSITYYNDICNYVDKVQIPDQNDLELLKENPQAYEWEFRIFNSY